MTAVTHCGTARVEAAACRVSTRCRRSGTVSFSDSPAVTYCRRGELGTSIIAPKTRLSLATNYVKGSFSWYWQAQYTSGMNFNNLNTPTSQDILTVGHWWLINSSMSYYVTDRINVRLVVNNVFDKKPPLPALAGVAANFTAATSYYFAGIIGRNYQLTIDANIF